VEIENRWDKEGGQELLRKPSATPKRQPYNGTTPTSIKPDDARRTLDVVVSRGAGDYGSFQLTLRETMARARLSSDLIGHGRVRHAANQMRVSAPALFRRLHDRQHHLARILRTGGIAQLLLEPAEND
jgi:hypothetical protein